MLSESEKLFLQLPDRCPSSRQIIIDLPDENKEKPKDSFISEELMMEMMDTQREGDNGDKIVDDEATTTTSTSTATESLLIT